MGERNPHGTEEGKAAIMTDQKEPITRPVSFGQRLRALRREAGMSQETLAERLEVSRQAVSKWENDLGFPETEKLLRLGELFGVSMDDLLAARTGEPVPGRSPAGKKEPHEPSAQEREARPAAGPEEDRAEDSFLWEEWFWVRKKRAFWFALGWALLLESGTPVFLLPDGSLLSLLALIGGGVLILLGALTQLPAVPQPLSVLHQEALRRYWNRLRPRGVVWLVAFAGAGAIFLMVLPMLGDMDILFAVSVAGTGLCLGGVVYWGILFRSVGRLLRPPVPWKG